MGPKCEIKRTPDVALCSIHQLRRAPLISALGPARVSFALLPLTESQLEWLAASRVPEDLSGRAEPESLPPSFVAARTLGLVADGHPKPWSTTFLIVRSEDGRFVGACGFKHAPTSGRVEVGYGVSPSARRTGAATAALKLLTELAFEAGATEVLAEVQPDNVASTRLVEKAGFVEVGTRVDEDNDFVTQWLRRSGA
jgi:[ribosomal protein S5]-alanine N-acetyltransferase